MQWQLAQAILAAATGLQLDPALLQQLRVIRGAGVLNGTEESVFPPGLQRRALLQVPLLAL